MENSGITPDQLYDYITSQMSPEEALKKLLKSSLRSYDKLKFEEGEQVHPLFIIANAAMDMNWAIAIKKGETEDEEVQGICVGTSEYLDSIFKD